MYVENPLFCFFFVFGGVVAELMLFLWVSPSVAGQRRKAVCKEVWLGNKSSRLLEGRSAGGVPDL